MVVLHDFANAVCSATSPSSKLSSFGIWRPSMFSVPGQLTMLSGVTCPACSAAETVTVLNVDPGG
jgi:hypothetical protein